VATKKPRELLSVISVQIMMYLTLDTWQLLGYQQHTQRHSRFLPLMNDNFYNCEFCGVGIAVIQIVTGGNGEGRFKVCDACLKLYIDEEANHLLGPKKGNLIQCQLF
jgi:hypothetical protein